MEAKVVEFINLHQGGTSVLEYSLKFKKLSKYAPSLVFDPRDEMNHFVTGVSDELQEECHSIMLHENMNIYRLMVYAQQVQESRAKRKSRDAKREKSFDRGSSKGRLDIPDKPRFKKRFSNQVPSKLTKAHDYRVSNLKPEKGRDTSLLNKKPTSAKCGKGHLGECLVRTDNFFSGSMRGHKVKDLTNMKGKEYVSGEA
ncbi:uncharacterized protein [Solanum lycopersicum]|uniref:uncharacterized protein n=1 Tax=Solanum lycopersicum TaxID=4081 RepID=UPI00374794BB